MNTAFPIILASGSPRRRELLQAAGVEFGILVSNAEEVFNPSNPPEIVAESLAEYKARASADAHPEESGLFIGADTIVVLDGHIFGKPKDEADAASMLEKLSNRTHQVTTGVCFLKDGEARCFHETTDVTFRDLSAEEIADYIRTGEPMDKAGAYGIQGLGGALVECIDGDFDNVVGLPVERVLKELEKLG